MRKSLFLILLSICVISFTTVTVFAAGAPSGGSTTIQVTTTIDNSPDFMLSIPTSIPMEDIQRTAESSIKSKSFSIELSNAPDMMGQQVDIAVATPDGIFALYYDVYSLPYQLYNQASGGTPLKSGDLFASFTQNGEVTGRVEVDEMNIPATGTYSGSLQFIVTVKDRNS
ncbi:MAG: hypothetical protein IJX19_04770 [Clostridia bacterium]|nr:hypothetical protein [Clostridia bacterium]